MRPMRDPYENKKLAFSGGSAMGHDPTGQTAAFGVSKMR